MVSSENCTDILKLTEALDNLKENVDQVYLLTNAIFVTLMQCGFACLEAGSIRSKNVTNIMMKNVMDIFISCLAYWLIGYALAYGQGNSFMGLTYWAGMDIPEKKYAHWFFQFVFAATAATIVSGAVAERCNFVAYLVYSAVISGFIYPVVSHWAWTESGWLSTMGYSDFAGSGAVHLLGGTCSLVAAVLLGPRTGRFDGKDMPGHSMPLLGIGGMILITGFLAFNGGSLGTMTTQTAGSTISRVIANTVVGGTGAAIFSLIACKAGLSGPKVWSFCITLNASLTGMVSVCAAANEFTFWSAFVTGLLGGAVYLGFHHLIPYCKVDDPLDAIAVHLGGGLWGLLSGPLFKENGIVYNASNDALLGFVYNLAGALAIFVWSSGTSLIMFGILKLTNYLRISEAEELQGLDISKHGQPAYPAAAWGNYVKETTCEHQKGNQVTTYQGYLNRAFQS